MSMSSWIGAARCSRRAVWSAPRGARFYQPSLVRFQTDEELLGKIKSDLKDAMRAKDSFKSTVIRGLLSDHQYASKASSNSTGEVSMSSIMQRAVARRQESSRQFRAANPAREDLAEKEDREAAMIQEFLPQQMPVEELEAIVGQVIAEVQKAGISGKRMMGEVMKSVATKVDKSRAPGSVVSEVVRKLLPKE